MTEVSITAKLSVCNNKPYKIYQKLMKMQVCIHVNVNETLFGNNSSLPNKLSETKCVNCDVSGLALLLLEWYLLD